MTGESGGERAAGLNAELLTTCTGRLAVIFSSASVSYPLKLNFLLPKSSDRIFCSAPFL